MSEQSTKKDAKQEKISEMKVLYKAFLEKKELKEVISLFANLKMVHQYSFRNRILANIEAIGRGMEKYKGTLNSYANWKKLGYSVLKGEKGLPILFPFVVKVKKEEGEENEEKIINLTLFKIGYTFDISQTTAYEDYLKAHEEAEEKVWKNATIEYEEAKGFVVSNFPEITIIEKEDPNEEAKGFYNEKTRTITILSKTSQTMFHELGHHLGSKLNLNFKGESSYAKNEVIAELGCYLLTKAHVEDIEYNFTYSNIWSSRIVDNFEIKDFENIFKTLGDYIANLFKVDE